MFPALFNTIPRSTACSEHAMKLVTEFLTVGEAELASSTLEAAGIATFISNRDSARLPVAGNAGGIGLWVMVDEQLWDAQQLLEDPDHQVQVQLTEAQQREIKASIQDEGMHGALGLLFKLLGAAVLLVVAVYWITRF